MEPQPSNLRQLEGRAPSPPPACGEVEVGSHGSRQSVTPKRFRVDRVIEDESQHE